MAFGYQSSFLKLVDCSHDDIRKLLSLAATLKDEKKSGCERQRLCGKNVALIFQKTSTRTRCAFEVACYDQGACCTYLGPGASQFGEKESVADTAKVLGRFYDAIEYRGFSQQIVEELAAHAGVPVYNGLTDEFHPTQMLADLLTMQEHGGGRDLRALSFAYLGDARNNMGHSLLLAGALMGMDVRIGAPRALQPSDRIIAMAHELADKSGARVLISEEARDAVRGCDFVHTDIWVSMGEDATVWQERMRLLMPYRIDGSLMRATGNPEAKFMHCLPAYHDRATPLGEQFFQSYGLQGIEVDQAVFTGDSSIVFDQAENRMHTIKALLVATLCDGFGESE